MICLMLTDYNNFRIVKEHREWNLLIQQTAETKHEKLFLKQ